MDERAFARLAEEYAKRLYAVAFRLLGNRADAEDAVQRALLKSFAARDSYSPRWAVSTWLYRILTNVCVDELRRRRPSVDVAATTVSAPSAASAIGARVDIGRALEVVPREARVLLALHYVDGLSHRELATIRGISVNTVKSQLARGKAILRAELEGLGRSRAPSAKGDSHGSARRPPR
jgi:RNA polymerase sigma-70 factor, ECF subfamily